MAMNVADSIPPMTPVPMAFIAPAPAPWAMKSGTTPRTKAMDVMMMGLSLSLDPSSVASMRPCPFSIWSLANWTMRIAFLAVRPSVVKRPIWK